MWRPSPAAPAGALLLAVLASACGAAPSPNSGTATPSPAATSSQPASSTPTTTSSPGEVATLDNAARGTTTYVRVNARVEVTLTADPGYTFSAPSSGDQSVLRSDAAAQTAAGATAEFRALRPGTATISAAENPRCLPQCGLPSRLWEATVTVTSPPVP